MHGAGQLQDTAVKKRDCEIILMLNLTGDISGCFHSLTPNIRVSFSLSLSPRPALLAQENNLLIVKKTGGELKKEREILKEKGSLVTSNN